MTILNSKTILILARQLYHWLPLPLRIKWRLREGLWPLIAALRESTDIRGGLKGAAEILMRQKKSGLARDNGREYALARILQSMACHAEIHGPVRHWIALPFLATGGAEMVALNFCRALRQLCPDESIALLITDRGVVNDALDIPNEVQLVVFDDYLADDLSYERKQALLHELLVAVKPACFHNINSEVAWHLIVAEGERLKHFTRLFASIFAFQFSPDGRKKIGYAAYFLRQAMPHLTGLLSDNQRFVDDAVQEYALSDEERARMSVLYQPCRLLPQASDAVGGQWRGPRECKVPSRSRRLQVLWAGRLDVEKRVDLFLEVVRRCTFADFRVFGQVVLDEGACLPELPNLSYEGPFSSPMEWVDRFDFDAFVFTSRWEGMPNILIEVGALGIPVVAPTVGGVGELVSTETGYPLPERPSVDDYEQALQTVSERPLDARERVTRMLDLVLERHAWGSFVAAVKKVPGYLDRSSQTTMSEVVDRATKPAPLVSVIIPCYNQARYLRESISSVLAACQHPVEIIVVDDGSTDVRTEQFLADVERLAPGVVNIVRQVNQGLSGARNSGIDLARGEYIQLLDADDLLAPGKIDAQIAQMQVNPDLGVSVCNFLLCDESRSDFSKPEEAIARFDLSEHDFLYHWERGLSIPIHCGLFRRRVLADIRFNTQVRAKEDWLFWTSLGMAGVQFGYIHGHWAMYRQHDGSMRRSYVKMGQAWLQAGLKIDSLLAGREPLFFESVVAWFEQCYRTHPSYRQEVAAIHAQAGLPHSEAVTVEVSAGVVDPDEILRSLEVLPKDTQLPLISVVIPIYGHYEYLRGCIMSLSMQGDVPMEIVCIDDASPDPRVATLLGALKDRHPCLKIHMQITNKGISDTQNAAVDMARGEFVAFLDCDDELEPGALAMVRKCLSENPEVDYLFTDRFDVDEYGRPIRVSRYGGYENLHFSSQDGIALDLLDGMIASHLKVIRRSVYKEVGGCDVRCSGVQDWDLALKVARKHRFHYLDKPLYRHRVHRGSVTRGDLVAQFRKTNVVRRKYVAERVGRGEGSSEGGIKIFRIRDSVPSLSALKMSWGCGEVCAMDTRGGAALGINFLREFNSYFDYILWDDPQVPVALYDFLWRPSILVHVADGEWGDE